MDCVQQTVFTAEHGHEFTGYLCASSVEQPEDLSALDWAAETGDRAGVLDDDHVAGLPHRGHVRAQLSDIHLVTAHFGRTPRKALPAAEVALAAPGTAEPRVAALRPNEVAAANGARPPLFRHHPDLTRRRL
jgi:hypothetical protein